MLKDFGHPLVVAGGYQRFQQLIGPTIYPFYVFTLKVVLAVFAAGWLAIFILNLIGLHGEVLSRVGGSIVGSLVFAFGVVTLVMAAIERSGGAQKLIDTWQPKTLPPVMPRAKNRPFESAFELAFSLAFIAWWVGLIHFPQIRFPIEQGGEVSVTMAAVWQTYFWPILALGVIACAIDVLDLVRPDLVRTGAIARIGYRIATLGMVATLALARPLMVFAAPGLDAATTARIGQGVDLVSAFILLGVALGAVIEIGKAALRIWRVQGQS